MSCNNCYNGCVETTSDKCVRYTGNAVEDLNIESGDSLYVVEQALIDAVVSFLDGTGIDITINPTAYCSLVTGYLPVSPTVVTPTAVQLFEALVKAACSLQTQVTSINSTLNTLNADYTIDCLTGVTASSDTHAIVQAVIDKLCDLGVDLAALALDVDTNYVKLADLDTLIQAYLDSSSGSSAYYTKMVPYTVVEYYGTLTHFDSTGAGTGDWINIYLCNGENGTPDKRGRVPVGAIQLVPGGTLNAAVNPATPGNPNYAVLDTMYGANTITLDATQIPSHTHIATVTDTHYHYVVGNDTAAGVCITPVNNSTPIASNGTCGTNPQYELSQSAQLAATLGKSSGTQGTLAVSNSSVGDGLGHSNIQPTLACYYIMYIP